MTDRRCWRQFGQPWVLIGAVLATAPTVSVAQEPDVAAIDSIFGTWDRPDSPGCVVGVSRAGALVYRGAFGSADLDAGIPLSPDKVFYLASVSKQFTATALVLLVLDGEVSLDDDVRRYVPELPDYGETITLRHILTHTSGLRDYLELMDLAGLPLSEPHDAAEILELVSRQRALNFPPGDQYLYSNTGYFLVPIIVERVSGRTIRAFMEERVFGPLEMEHTLFYDDHREPVPNRALSYRRVGDGFELAFLDTFDQVGSGGVLSTVDDLAKWDASFYTGAVAGDTLLALLQTRGLLTAGDTIAYALGLTIDEYLGQRTVSHGGAMMGFKTHLLRFPERRLSVICLCNLSDIDPGDLARRVAEPFLEPYFTAYRQAFVGTYHSPEVRRSFEILVEDGQVRARPPGEPELAMTLAYAGPDRFSVGDGMRVRFERDDRTRVVRFVLDAGRVRGLVFERR